MNYDVRRVPSKMCKEYMRLHHYSHSCHNGPSPCYGLFDGDALIGAIAFATPCSENVRAWVFGRGQEHEVIELHRLYVADVTPRNAESYFISRALKHLKADVPRVRAVVSFSDATEGHTGAIYAASNFVRTGSTSRAWFYRDAEGALRHPRQNGVNISLSEAEARGWTRERRAAKTRWHYPLGDNRKDTRRIRAMLTERSGADNDGGQS